jgi:hypothetical protein
MKIYSLMAREEDLGYGAFIGAVVIAKSVEDSISVLKEEFEWIRSDLLVSDLGIAHEDQIRKCIVVSFETD